MRTLKIMTVVLFLNACSVEPPGTCGTGSKETAQSCAAAQTTSAPTQPATSPTVSKQATDTMLCAFNPGQGCLHANITAVNLGIGEFSYKYGVTDFSKKFPQDFGHRYVASFEEGDTVAFSDAVTVNNFYYGFGYTVEGAAVNYSPVTTGLGNLQINNMAAGHYSMIITKQFDLTLIRANETDGSRFCVIIAAMADVDIVVNAPSSLSSALNHFDLIVYNESCFRTQTVATVGKKKATDAAPTPSVGNGAGTTGLPATATGATHVAATPSVGNGAGTAGLPATATVATSTSTGMMSNASVSSSGTVAASIAAGPPTGTSVGIPANATGR